MLLGDETHGAMDRKKWREKGQATVAGDEVGLVEMTGAFSIQTTPKRRRKRFAGAAFDARGKEQEEEEEEEGTWYLATHQSRKTQ